MTTFTSTPKAFCIFKDELPEVHTSKRDEQPYVNIPDPENPERTIRFLAIQDDSVEALFNLAAAYLALAQNQQAKIDRNTPHWPSNLYGNGVQNV